MTVHPSAANLVRQMWPKIQPRRPREPKKPLTKRPKDTGPSLAARALLRARSEGLCERCGKPLTGSYRGEVHHLQNRSQGVDNRLSNLGDLDPACHAWIGREPKLARVEGWHLENGDEPGAIAVLYRPRVEGEPKRWMFLDEDGSLTPASEMDQT